MRNILVTGGAGFIGSNFIRYLLRVEPAVNVINLDALTYAGSLENLKQLPNPDRHIFIRADIRDTSLVEKILREHEIDTVVHFAAETHVDRSIMDPAPFIQTNVLGTANLLEAVREYWMKSAVAPDGKKRFHHISTDEVYGSLALDEPAWTEESPPMRRARRMRLPKPPATTWCTPTVTPTACR
jgi:dTDP-glucose 4,6-dehydratase